MRLGGSFCGSGGPFYPSRECRLDGGRGISFLGWSRRIDGRGSRRREGGGSRSRLGCAGRRWEGLWRGEGVRGGGDKVVVFFVLAAVHLFSYPCA